VTPCKAAGASAAWILTADCLSSQSRLLHVRCHCHPLPLHQLTPRHQLLLLPLLTAVSLVALMAAQQSQLAAAACLFCY
jgi:hypothetical protein